MLYKVGDPGLSPVAGCGVGGFGYMSVSMPVPRRVVDEVRRRLSLEDASLEALISLVKPDSFRRIDGYPPR